MVNLRERRIEKSWPGEAAWWSPDGKWIAALSFGSPSEINLIRASDLSTERTLGPDTSGRLQWSPDSRYLLLLANGLCVAGFGYFGCSSRCWTLGLVKKTAIRARMQG